MIPLPLTAVADVVGGSLLAHDTDPAIVTDVTIDSRTAVPGSLFVALPGSHTDGHAYAGAACAAGAVGVLAELDRAAALAGQDGVRGVIAVDDPADALLALGVWVRETVDPLVVTVTGSQGKTTTKDLTAAAIATRRRVVANEGSYNNELGVPLTCCALQADTEVLVAEIGARGSGHIATLAGLLKPDVAVVTMVSPAHIELLGSLDAVAEAKSELVESLEADGVAILNADDHRVAAMAMRTSAAVMTYGQDAAAAWRARDVTLDDSAHARFTAHGPTDRVGVRLPLPGRHNVGNALAALAAATACGVDPSSAADGLAGAAVSRWRMELHTRADGVRILNDAYNANPVSTAAALDALAVLPAARRWAVLGFMAELGTLTETAHREVGAHAAAVGIDRLTVVGDARPIADGARAAGFAGALDVVADVEEATELVAAALTEGDAVLVKASRSVGLERLAGALTEPRP